MKKADQAQPKQGGIQKKPYIPAVAPKPAGEKRKGMEEALRESEERYRITLYRIGDSIITTDTEGRVWQMNPAAEKLTGWREAEANGKPIGDVFYIVNEDTHREVESPVARVLREGLVVGLANHTLLIARNGDEHPIADSGAPIRNLQGEITGVVLVFRNQTDERAAEKTLRASEYIFRETITYLDEGYYSCTMDGMLVDHNRTFNQLLGFEVSQDLRGTKLPDFWQNPEDRNRYVSELMTHGVVNNYLINVKTIGGVKIVILANSHLVKDDQGTPIKIEGTFTDYTERKRVEDALKDSETKYRALFENAQVGIYRTKLDGSAFLEVNNKFAEIIGFSRQELIGSPGRIRWANAENRDKMLKQLQAQGGILTNYEVQVVAKNGEVKDVLASIKLYPDEGNIEGTMTDITERKQAERALRQSENTVLAWLNAFQESAFLMDRAGVILAANATVAQRLHRPVEELVGACIYDFIPPETAHARRLHVAQVIASGQPVRFEDERSGRIIDNLIYPVFDQSGQVKQMAILGTDITERKQIEETIRSLARFPAENPSPVLRIARNGNLLYANDAAFLLLTDWKLKVGKLAPDVLKDPAGEVFETRTTKTVEISCGKRTFSISIAPAPGDDYINLYARDVTERLQAEREIRSLNAELEQRVADRTVQLQTANKQLESELVERKRVEDALRESEERFRHLSEAAFEAIVIHDTGILLNANIQYLEMFGYELEELMGKQVMPMTIAPEAIEAVKKEIATGGVGPYESTGKRKDGTRFPMEIRVRGIEYEGRKVRVAAIMDITERKRAGEALQQRTTQLETANRELEAFSYSISHDLRAPLRAMDGFSRILIEEYSPQLSDEAQRYLGLVRNNAQQMGHLIEDLLAFSRLSRLPLNKQVVVTANVVRQVLAELHTEQEGRNVIITIGDLPTCEADPALLKQVWVNLLSNALKFTRKCAAARIEVGVLHHSSTLSPNGIENGGDGPVFFVKDNGVGFDMQYANKLFGVFQRLHRAEDYEGTGVGLAIVQRIVNRHGGRVWTEAEMDKGAAFYFTLGGDA